jgi:hypothetical protein
MEMFGLTIGLRMEDCDGGSADNDDVSERVPLSLSSLTLFGALSVEVCSRSDLVRSGRIRFGRGVATSSSLWRSYPYPPPIVASYSSSPS